MNDLANIQNWIQTTLVSRGNLDEKLALAKEKTGLSLDEMIYSTKGVSAYERFDIYASGYVLRILECMRADFPKLQFFLGENLFDTFAKAYIVSINSSSWNLYYLGAKFADFLKQTQPNVENPLVFIPSELAHIERMHVESLQDKGIENTIEKSGNFLDVFTKNIRLKQVSCLRIMKQSYDLYEFFLNIQALHSCEIPEKKENYLAITRKNYKVQMYNIEKWQYHFLRACENEVSLNNAIQTVVSNTGMTAKVLRAKLAFWLALAFEMALIESI